MNDSPRALTWETLTSEMLREFPVLSEPYQRLHLGSFDWTPGQYVVFGDTFVDYMKTDAITTQVATAEVARFIERMASSRVENIEDLLRIDVFPALLRSQSLITHYWPDLGPVSKRVLRSLNYKLRTDIIFPPAKNKPIQH